MLSFLFSFVESGENFLLITSSVVKKIDDIEERYLLEQGGWASSSILKRIARIAPLRKPQVQEGALSKNFRMGDECSEDRVFFRHLKK